MRIKTENKSILTIPEASEQYGFPHQALRKLVKAGEIPIIKVGNRVYITRAVMEEYLRTGGR